LSAISIENIFSKILKYSNEFRIVSDVNEKQPEKQNFPNILTKIKVINDVNEEQSEK
jgi:hypothetical protein